MSAHSIKCKTVYSKDTKIWSGRKCQAKYSADCSIGKEAIKSLLKDPEHIAQISYPSGAHFTNREIANLSIRVAQHFKELGLQQCDIIGFCGMNSDYVAPLFFGAMLAGLTVSTLDPSFDKDGIKHTFGITKPVVMFCDGSIYDNVKGALIEQNLPVKIYTMCQHIQGVSEITEFLQKSRSEDAFVPQKLKNLQTAAILCSSGTTGLPKGVCMSHASLLQASVFDMHRDDKLLCFSTLYWLSGLMSLLYGTIGGTTRIIYDKTFSPEVFFHIVEKYKVTLLLGPPSQLAMSLACNSINNFDLSSVITYFCGGSAVPYLLVEKMKAFMPHTKFITCYGMSEICGGCAAGEAVSNGAIGQITDNFEIKITDEDGKLFGRNEIGEICIKPLLPWMGYYGNEEATFATYEDQTWIHSGDLGHFDDKGNLFVVDRKKDIFKYNNFHFYPSEIENVIYEIPGIAEVCVCGLPDIVSTHLPTAAIVRKTDHNLTEESVYDYVSNRMTHFKQLRGGVYFFEELPKTASGKYIRYKVADLCEQLRNCDTKIRNDRKIC